MRKILLLVLVALMAAPLAMAQKVFEMKLAHADSTDISVSRKHAQAVAFADLVNTRSGGRISVKVYGGGALGAEREYVEAIKAGTVEAGIASGVIANFFPSAMVTDIPFLFPSGEIAWKVMDGPFGDRLRAAFLKETGMRCLTFAEVGFRNFTNNVRPIRTPADMKGLKIRVQETPLYITLIKALGASPTPIAFTELYTSLQTKVVDGEENPIPTILMSKFAEVQKYLTLDGHNYGVDYFVINEKFYQSLPPDLQYVVLSCARISAAVGRGVQQLVAAEGVRALQDAKMEVYAPTAEELEMFKQATQQPVIDWLKTKIDPKLIQEILQVVKDTVAQQSMDLK
jgi:tripartite ATP-independent transporter DctP family solute receptor